MEAASKWFVTVLFFISISLGIEINTLKFQDFFLLQNNPKTRSLVFGP